MYLIPFLSTFEMLKIASLFPHCVLITITARKRSLRRLCFYTCLSFCSQGRGCLGPEGGWGVWPGGMSRPRPRGEVGGCLGPDSVQSHTRGSRPRPRGVSQHALRQTFPPHSRQLLLWAVRILLECILVLSINLRRT